MSPGSGATSTSVGDHQRPLIAGQSRNRGDKRIPLFSACGKPHASHQSHIRSFSGVPGPGA
jgi:hypothetical protein